MYNNENIKWFNQTLMSFKDKRYSTDGYFRVSLVTSTDNFKYFNPPLFSFSISNGHQKNCSLNIQNAEDLLESIKSSIQNSNGHETVIEKRYTQNMILYFKFAVESSNNERVVVIEMISSETDSAKVILPLKPTFQTFISRLKNYISNYDNLCAQLLIESTKNEMYEIVSQLPGLIKGISSQIIESEDIIPDTRAQEIDDNQVSEREVTINDLDKFIGGSDMSNVSIPEIDHEEKSEEKKTFVEVNSPFISDVLKNDLSVLENKLTSFSVSNIPVQDVLNELESELNIQLIPLDTSADEKKSVFYLSTSFFQKFSKDYTVNDKPIPLGIPVIKFNTNEVDEVKREIAYDLLLIIGYVRILRRRLEARMDNAYDNKSMFYLFVRCFLDPACFSYIEMKKELSSIIVNRYKHFKDLGIFEKYDNAVETANCPKIDESDIRTFVEELTSKNGNMDSLMLHDKLYSSDIVKLPSKNTFELEQIINEIIPLEVAERTGLDFQDSDVMGKFLENNNISEEIFKWYTGSKKATTTSSKPEKVTPLQRWIKKFKQDIPERFRDSVEDYVKELQYNTFDFSGCTWDLEEFDENIIKALYVWDPANDPKMKTNMTYFESLVENEVMSKDDILISAKSTKDKSSTASSNFDFSKLSLD